MTAANTPPGCVLRVAVAAPVPGLFDYLPPAGVDGTRLRRGQRLRVPFGRTTRTGFLWESSDATGVPATSLKPALELLDPEPLLSAADLALLRWAADYYQHPLGEVLATALPARLDSGGAAQTPAWRLTGPGRALAPGEPARAPRQAQVLERLRAAPEGLGRDDLYAQTGPCAEALAALIPSAVAAVNG